MKIFNSRAEAEVIGHVIILGITILGVSMITLYGVPAIYSLQDMANIKNVEQAFTLVDSRTSRATLGDAPLQITDVSLGGGTLTVLPNSSEHKSYYLIKRVNYTTGLIVAFNVSMGKIIYDLGDREIAYEGGGVWSKYPSGSIMISPPEFHYNGETLTLPVMNITTSASAGGKGTASLKAKLKNLFIEYPKDADRSNPVSGDKVFVVIYSDYYDAWAEFANNSQYIHVAKNIDGQNSVNISLRVVPEGGTRLLVPPIRFRGIDPSDRTPLENFYFNFSGVGSNLQMDLRAPNSCPLSNTPSLDIQIKKESGGGTSGIRIRVIYSEGGKTEEFWSNTLIAINDGDADVDLLNSSLATEYNSNVDSWTWNNPILDGSYTKTYNNTNRGPVPLDNVTQHYARVMGEKYGGSFDLYAGTCHSDMSFAGSQWPDTAASTYTLEFDPLGGITYLHVTRNDVEASIS